MKFFRVFFFVSLVLSLSNGFFLNTVFADVANTVGTDTLSDTVLCSGSQSGNYQGYQYLGQGLSGKLSEVDIKLVNAGPVYYGKRISMHIFESDILLNSFNDIISSSLVWQKGDTFQTSFNINSFDGVVAFTSPDFGSDYNFIPAKHYYLVPKFYTSDGGGICQSSYLYGSLDSNPFSFGQFYSDTFVKDIYFDLHGLSQSLYTPHSSVLFLPGIEASRLYDSSNLLWEPSGDSSVESLGQNADGISQNADIYASGVIDNAYFPIKGNIYKSFIEQMDGLKTDGTIADWQAVPYDWRLSLEQILTSGKLIEPNKISYLLATSSPYIIQELRRLAVTSDTGKVTIVAHSNGGLLTKKLTDMLGSEAGTLIDKIIFVAVPQVGTPKALGAILHGFDQSLGTFTKENKMSKVAARTMAKNMPSAYTLVPSAGYFTQVDDPVATFDASGIVAPFRERYGEIIHSQEMLNTFVTDSWRNASSTASDLVYPSVGNPVLLSQAETIHTSMDAWTPPVGVSLYEIAGWGEETLATIEYYQGRKSECSDIHNIDTCSDVPALLYRPKFTLDGDGTVVVPSALWVEESASTTKYWVNLKLNNKGITINRKHADILEVPTLRTLIQNIILATSTNSLPANISTSIPINNSPETQLRFALHSPLTLDLYDNLGNHTGISTTTEQIEENILDSRYEIFGEVQHISIPTSTTVYLFMTGLATGSFTLEINEVSGNNIIASTTFSGVPTSSSTLVTMNIPQNGGIASASNLEVDLNGDGTTDISLAPSLGGVVTIPPPPIPEPAPVTPSTTPTSSGGGNGPPVAQSVPATIASTSPDIASPTASTGSPQASTTQVVASQRSDLRNPLQGQTLAVKPKEKKVTQDVVVKPQEPTIEVKPNNQVATIISSNPKYLSWFSNLWKKTVNWLVAIIK